MLVDDDQIRVLLRIADTLQYALRVFLNRLVRWRTRQIIGCLIRLVTRLNSKLIDPGPVGAGAAAGSNQSRRAGYERNGQIRCVEVGWCCGLSQCVSRSGMSEVAVFEFAKCVLDACV